MTSAAFSPAETYLVTGDGGGAATIWYLYGDKEPIYLGHNRGIWTSVTAVAYAGDDHIITGTAGGLVSVWNSVNGERIEKHQFGEKEITAVVYEPHAGWFAAASQDGTVYMMCRLTDGDLCVMS